MVVQKHQQIINTDYAVTAFFESSAFNIIPGRENKISQISTQPHIMYKSDNINRAAGLQLGHDCVIETEQVCKVRPDTRAMPLPKDCDPTHLYIDGSCHRAHERRRRDGLDFVLQGSGPEVPPSA